MAKLCAPITVTINGKRRKLSLFDRICLLVHDTRREREKSNVSI